jgi:hypothetical protein
MMPKHGRVPAVDSEWTLRFELFTLACALCALGSYFSENPSSFENASGLLLSNIRRVTRQRRRSRATPSIQSCIDTERFQTIRRAYILHSFG